MRKVLFVNGQEVLLKQNDGGKKCSYSNYRILQGAYGQENVYIRMYTNEFTGDEERVMREKSHKTIFHKIINVFLLRPFFSIKQEKELLNHILANNYDMVFFERTMFGPITKKLNKQGVKTGVFAENIEKEYVWNKVKKQNLFYLLPYVSTKYNEKLMLKYVDSVVCLTKRDSDLLMKLYCRKSNAIIPITFVDEYNSGNVQNKKSDTKTLMFIGSCFAPNYDGILWFVNNVMPFLQDYTLIIVGKGFEQKAETLSRTNVEVVGTVSDLSEYYSRDAVIVMPILYGNGIKIKTAEALMYGKNIFATDEALVGYEIDNIEGIYRCNSAEEFVDKINDFYNEKGKYNIAFNEKVRECFLDKYEHRRGVELFQDAFEVEG